MRTLPAGQRKRKEATKAAKAFEESVKEEKGSDATKEQGVKIKSFGL